jgi:hypothetical protein
LTPELLNTHFPPQQSRNVGILNGAPSSNTLDVDLDCPEALVLAPRLLPSTGWVFGRKSAPRSHWVYKADQPLDAAQEKFTDLQGAVLIELRGTGGLTVFPPSTHKDTGEAIAWARFSTPGEVTLSDLQQAVREVAAAALLARHWPAKGTRQDACLALVGGLLRGGWAQERVKRFLAALIAVTKDEERARRIQCVDQTAKKLAQDKPTTGWPMVEKFLGAVGGDVVRQVRQWLGMAPAAGSPGKKPPRPPEPYQPFPIESLPAPLAAYVGQAALALGCDPAYVALPALVVAASAIGNTRVLRLKRGWEEPSVVWSAIVGDSGTLKSPAYLKAVSYLFRVQHRLFKEFKDKLAQYEEERERYEAAKRKAAKGDGDDPGEPPEEPFQVRVVCSDTTVEKLAEILADNPRGTLVARDELAGWLGSFTRYKGRNGGTDLPNWLEMHRAGTVIVDRKTPERPTLFIHRAAVSITGGIQPGILARELTTEFLDAGLGARLLKTMPPSCPNAGRKLRSIRM